MTTLWVGSKPYHKILD